MPPYPGLVKLIHHYVTNTAIPYISNANVVESRVHFRAGSNILTSIYNYLSKRPGFAVDTTDTFTSPIARVFVWQRWDGTRFKMLNTTSTVASTSTVYKLKIGTDTNYGTVFTSSTSAAHDFVVSNNFLYFGNGTDMKKYNGTTTSNWGIAQPSAAATTSSVAAGAITAANGGYRWVYAFKNSSTGHIGQRSAVSTITGNFTSLNYVITGSTTTDGQVDQVSIYRTTDGGPTFFELPNSPVSYSGSWSITDTAPDTSLTTTQASLAAQNSPPTASSGPVFYAGRIWTFAGDTAYFSNFEEQINGIQEESFSNVNQFAFGQPVKGLAPVQKALLVFTPSAIFRITGDTLTTFKREPFVSRMGVTSSVNIALGGLRTVAWLDTNGSIFITDGISTQEIGYPIRSDLNTINQTLSSLAFHNDAIKSWLIVQDSGQDKMWAYDLDNGIWMPPWSIGGTAITSGETTQGNYTLLLGRGAKPLKLTTSNFQDLGANYTGSITTNLMEMGEGKGPGEVADLQYVAIERNNVALGDIGFEVDEDTASATYQSIFSNEQNPPNRPASSTALVEKWYYHQTATTTGRRVSIKMDWAAGSSEFKLYAFDVVTNQDESA